MPRTSPSLLTISVTTSPQPPWRLTRRRKAVSVMPAIGATTSGDSSATLPMVGCDTCPVVSCANVLPVPSAIMRPLSPNPDSLPV